jgi:hypothetical protein
MAFGVTPEGFSVKTLADIIATMQTKQLQSISPSLDVQATALIGNVNGIVGAEIAEVWLVLLALYNGMDPDQAADDQLTNLCLITGTERLGASATVVPATVNVGASFHADAGTMFASITGSPSAIFTNEADVDNPGGSPANIAAVFKAVATGPTQCLAGTLTVISSPLTGWNSITNATDGTPGRAIQGDPSLRQTRNQDLSAAGTSTTDAIRADVLEKLQPPTTTTETVNCRVLANNTDVTDANNLPPHTIEVIAYQPGNTSDDDVALATLIAADRTAATGTYGLAFKDVTDSQGVVERIFYTRPSPIDLHIAITVLVDATTFPLDGAAQVKNALLNYAALEFGPGGEVFLRPLSGSVFPSPLDPAIGVVGVKDISSFTCDTNPVPVGTSNIPIGIRQVASFDSSRIAVTVVPG